MAAVRRAESVADATSRRSGIFGRNRARSPLTTTMKPVSISLVALAACVAAAPAQTHTRSDLILGNTATFAAESPAGLFALFALSQAGLGPPVPIPGLGAVETLPPILLSPLVAVEPDGPCVGYSFVIPATLAPSPLGSQALLLEPGQFALSNALGGDIESLSAFDDDFAGSSLAGGWQVYNPHLIHYSVNGGELHLQPIQGGPAVTWFGNGEGACIYRVVRGDFTVVAQVRSYRLSNPLLPPPANYDMAGLTVRDPLSVPGAHDWLHVAVGGGVPSNPIVVEDKSTDDSTSSLLLHRIAQPSGQVRVSPDRRDRHALLPA